MANPKRINISVPGTKYDLEIDLSRWDCRKEPPHCHVTNGRSRVAQVWLSSCTFEEIPREISHNDQSRILDTVASNKYALLEVFNHNYNYGAD